MISFLIGIITAAIAVSYTHLLTQALGVFIDTIVICSCTAMIMLTAPENIVAGKEGMDLLQSAMRYQDVYKRQDLRNARILRKSNGRLPMRTGETEKNGICMRLQ